MFPIMSFIIPNMSMKPPDCSKETENKSQESTLSARMVSFRYPLDRHKATHSLSPLPPHGATALSFR